MSNCCAPQTTCAIFDLDNPIAHVLVARAESINASNSIVELVRLPPLARVQIGSGIGPGRRFTAALQIGRNPGLSGRAGMEALTQPTRSSAGWFEECRRQWHNGNDCTSPINSIDHHYSRRVARCSVVVTPRHSTASLGRGKKLSEAYQSCGYVVPAVAM